MAANQNPYTIPPGLMGALTNFFYAAAPRPVPEIALAAAIGFMAGVCGRAYNTSGTGLIQYILVVAPTGTGKSAIASGTDKLINAIRNDVPSAELFIGPGVFASGPALLKYIASTSNCFVTMQGEFGLTLQAMTSPRASAHLVQLKQALLDLYSKSGAGEVLRASQYSQKENSTPAVESPAVSLIGEGTPETVFGPLNETSITDGLLPRFLLIEYKGPRVPLQENRIVAPWPELANDLKTLTSHAHKQMHNRNVIDVQPDYEARRIFKDFGEKCDRRINDADTGSVKELWNRAYLKVVRLAALVAVGVNPFEPTITATEALWAIGIEEANINNLLSRFECGEVGDQTDDNARVNKLREIINAYFERSSSEFTSKSLLPLQEHRKAGVIPERYLFQRTNTVTAFKNARQGARLALKSAIEQLISFGEIVRVPNKQLPNFTASHAALYALAEESTALNGKMKAAISQRRQIQKLFEDAS